MLYSLLLLLLMANNVYLFFDSCLRLFVVVQESARVVFE